MIKRILLLLVLCPSLFTAAQEMPLQAGMKISRTVQIKKGVYRLDAPADTSKPVLLIEGDNLVIDFNAAELTGSNGEKTPDEFFGIAILVRNSKNITIKNLKARGYKVALLARNVEQLTLEQCDFSYNYRPHLNSTQEKEDLSDWLSYHHNEKDEWLRYGAAMYLRNCDRALIRNCRVTGGQNALLMMESDHGKIYNNDFSFNSGIGIGLYRCNANEFSFNRLNFNVRGYSHGVYNRGQDSAGFLVYEQSNYNVFYKNSATHSGDGFFLWAGQATMDTGEGGCNDNVIMENDFSYAPTNGVEVTFSRVAVTGNRIFECDHGIWGGYSYSSKFCNNQFRDNRIAIAIEHGLHNEISYNLFSKDKEAIRLWSGKQQSPDWGYVKHRDTRSADYIIAMNSFNQHSLVLNLTRTDSLRIAENTYSGENKWKLDSTVTNIDTSEVDLLDTAATLPDIENPADPFKGNGKLAGRKNILITEWGPYDFRSPIIWNTNPTDTSAEMKFDLLGPKGKWKVKSFSGVEAISAMNGEFPAHITARKVKASRTDIRVELEYTGEAITTPFGEKRKAGQPWNFRFRKFFQPIDWDLAWYAFDSMSNPVKYPEYMLQLDKIPPVREENTDRIDYAWWGGIRAGEKQYPQFITIGNGSAKIPEGNYELSVTWDDAVRLWVDGELLLDEWEPANYKSDESPNRKIKLYLNGNHTFRVEHVELGGFATLGLQLRKLD
ncbi:MAG: right-handed parallel beta-helix repeat-containing protein [Sphingobacteriales bacterium]|nr:right-handed parallel beta-helix repeat-containing protein [Sphingobacteriales bacterium]